MLPWYNARRTQRFEVKPTASDTHKGPSSNYYHVFSLSKRNTRSAVASQRPNRCCFSLPRRDFAATRLRFLRGQCFRHGWGSQRGKCTRPRPPRHFVSFKIEACPAASVDGRTDGLKGRRRERVPGLVSQATETMPNRQDFVKGRAFETSGVWQHNAVTIFVGGVEGERKWTTVGTAR